jgi:hypothetical protein
MQNLKNIINGTDMSYDDLVVEQLSTEQTEYLESRISITLDDKCYINT